MWVNSAIITEGVSPANKNLITYASPHIKYGIKCAECYMELLGLSPVLVKNVFLYAKGNFRQMFCILAVTIFLFSTSSPRTLHKM